MYRYHGRAEINPDDPHAQAICDRCGFLYNLKDLVWQYDYVGGSTPINLRILVCTRTCLDEINPQFALQILPPDPPPLYNVRPEPFSLDESGPTEIIATQVFYPQASIGAFYLDLYNGNPTGSGTSVLAAITGSATRTNFASSMGPLVGTATTNASQITFTTNSLASTNVSYLAVFSAATAGTLLTSAPLFNPVTAVLDNGIAFGIGDLTAVVMVVVPENLFWGGNTPLFWGTGNALQW